MEGQRPGGREGPDGSQPPVGHWQVMQESVPRTDSSCVDRPQGGTDTAIRYRCFLMPPCLQHIVTTSTGISVPPPTRLRAGVHRAHAGGAQGCAAGRGAARRGGGHGAAARLGARAGAAAARPGRLCGGAGEAGGGQRRARRHLPGEGGRVWGVGWCWAGAARAQTWCCGKGPTATARAASIDRYATSLLRCGVLGRSQL